MSNLALYIHWPFCVSKCPYCDFNSHVSENIDQDSYASAYEKDIAYNASRLKGRVISSIFFGGGTPSLMNITTLQRIMHSLRQAWDWTPDIEITLEANPNSAEAAKFLAMREIGINRISLGVQSLNDKSLKFLGRAHSSQEALSAMTIARQIFPRVSFDLIYALPGQTLTMWQDELMETLEYKPNHLSAYQLTIEEGTAFHTQTRKNLWSLPNEDIQADLYEQTQILLSKYSLPAYEVSNHSLPNEQSRHNLTYWHYKDYLGIGPGAHSRITNKDNQTIAMSAYRKPENWRRAVDSYENGVENSEALHHKTRTTEALMMGMRLVEGVAIASLEKLASMEIDAILNMERVNYLCDNGLLQMAKGRIFAPNLCLLNSLITSIMKE